MSDTLFPVADIERQSTDRLSADQRRTIRRNQLLASGTHPTTRLPLLADSDATCRTCTHCIPHTRNRTYWKCDQVELTFGPGSDVRLSWPACTRYKAAS